MSAWRRGRARRVETIQALALSRGFLGPLQQVVFDELDEVKAVERTPLVRRRHLLQLLHATRALDTTLREFTRTFNCVPKTPSLGGYLVALATSATSTVSPLPEASRTRYQSSIVSRRNRYAHEAGAFPATEAEVGRLLSEMEACLAEVFAL